jgi:hypothetical protein
MVEEMVPTSSGVSLDEISIPVGEKGKNRGGMGFFP